MTEEEFNRRLSALIQDAQSRQDLSGMDGIFDSIFSVVKNVVSKVGTGLKAVGGGIVKGVTVLGKGVFSVGGKIVANVGSAASKLVSSGAAKSLVEAGGAIVIAKKQQDMQRAELQLQQAVADQQQVQLQAAMAAQGVNISTPGAQQLFSDVTRQGIVGADGKILYPSAAQQIANAGGIEGLLSGKNLMPILAIAGAVFALAVVMPSNKGGKK